MPPLLSVPLPPPPVASEAESTSSLPTTVTPPASQECELECAVIPLQSPNLEQVIEQSTSQDIHQLLQLLEVHAL